VEVKDGIKDGTTYESASPNGPFLDFPPATTIRFFHGLKVNGHKAHPTVMQVMLAFSPYGSLAPSAGNESIIETIDDDKVDVKNDTCSDFNIWFVAGNPVVGPDDSDAGAGGVDAAAGAGGSTQ
jgi:hypothetical protein